MARAQMNPEGTSGAATRPEAYWMEKRRRREKSQQAVVSPAF